MKKILFLTMLLWSASFVKAQQNNEEPQVQQQASEEQIQAIKIGFITKKLGLTPDEAQKFWPIYNQYSDEVKKARKASIDKDDDPLQFEEKLLDIRKRYKQSFGKAINQDKVNKFWVIEHQFDNAVKQEFMRRRKMLQRRRN